MTVEAPLRRPVRIDTLPREGLAQTITATPDERAALAALNGLVEIAALTANFVVKRSGRGARVEGRVHAEVTQTCVVTLEPFATTIDEKVDVRFARPSEKKARAETETVELDLADPPDPIIDGKIDLGALTAEFLALALDPYPRKPGVAFAPPRGENESDSPFEELARIMKGSETR
jgi:uncharacterized metal-binding protein YceD (DUF177 family)